MIFLRVIINSAVNSESVQTCVVRMTWNDGMLDKNMKQFDLTMIVVDVQLDSVPGVDGVRLAEVECLDRIISGGVGEVEQRGDQVSVGV